MALINALLVRSQKGWSERLDTGSITTNTRFEAYLALGAVQTEEGVNAYADAQLDIYAIPREEVVAGIAPIGTVDLPYVGYRVGDTVTVPNSAGAPTIQRVRGITVTEDDDTGIAVYTPQFKDLILQRTEQVELVLKKMSNGTLSGSSMVAQPIREQFVPREVVPSDAFGTQVPFIVVANDGTGDFSDPKLAIDSVSAGVPTVIYFKNTGTSYTTTVSVDVSGKMLTLWGESALLRFPAAGTSGPYWTMGSANFTMDGTTVLTIKGMMIDSSAATLGMVAGAQVNLNGANIGNGAALSVGAGITIAYDSKFRIHSTSFSGNVWAWRSFVQLPNATMTLTTGDHRWHECQLAGGGSTHMTILYDGVTTGGQCSINDCDIGDMNEIIINNWNQATFMGNTNHGSVGGGVLSGNVDNLVFTACDRFTANSTMWGTILTINLAEHYNLGGVWHEATIDADGGSICATFDGDRGLGGTGPATLVTISGDHNVGSVFVNLAATNGLALTGANNNLLLSSTNMTTNTLNVSGNNNRVSTDVGSTNVDTGAGNVIL